MKRIDLVCPICSASSVERDAVACWSVQDQAWELQATFDQMRCSSCEANFNSPREVEALEDEEETPS
jgi:hypothetical protein